MMLSLAEHGTPSRYTNQRCRCDLCRAAWAAYKKAHRAAHPGEDAARQKARRKVTIERTRELGRIGNKVYSAAHPGIRRMHVATRRARKNGAFVEPINIAVLFERDAGVCGVCGAIVDWDLQWPNPLSKSHDHVIPLSHSGEHSYANAQLSHLVCNMQKASSTA